MGREGVMGASVRADLTCESSLQAARCHTSSALQVFDTQTRGAQSNSLLRKNASFLFQGLGLVLVWHRLNEACRIRRARPRPYVCARPPFYDAWRGLRCTDGRLNSGRPSRKTDCCFYPRHKYSRKRDHQSGQGWDPDTAYVAKQSGPVPFPGVRLAPYSLRERVRP